MLRPRTLRALRAVRVPRPIRLYSQESSDHPLRPNVSLTDLQQPVTPLDPPILSIPPSSLSRADLERLHTLAALNPPPAGSKEEAKLLEELNELVGLMDLVHEVEVNEDHGELLTHGVPEMVFDVDTKHTPQSPPEGKRDRELLEYATRRIGDYYGFKTEAKTAKEREEV
ncbi:hypothetical protein A1Q2_02982 [Trichosporon asahii var. asahii CBS 8904]|uniref:Glutamyl-tRNA(Gln) amidotransferase subunit F, mitochondrial n=1 Tax=Trichosporon asahii var. asahii (strain CBS 8904) TaxID=1220162 RepID=K1VT57_TRIAC|nr:hypothetical protein A1Q2_02982 [Trichosporon asahii var. asahii CBS 8904]